MPRHNFDKLRARLAEDIGADRLAEIERAAIARYDAEEKRLADVRRARSLTQAQLAKALGVSQAQVSRVETQADLYLSTLASYLEAMGGRLELVVAFDDTGERLHLAVGELAVAAAAAAGAIKLEGGFTSESFGTTSTFKTSEDDVAELEAEDVASEEEPRRPRPRR